MTHPPVVNPLATLPAPPPILPLWPRVLWYLVQTVAIGVQYGAFDYAAEMLGASSAAGSANADTWRRFHFHYENTITTEAADNQAFTIDVANITDGRVDGTWTESDYATVFNAMTSIGAGVAPAIANYLQLTRIDAYVMAFRPYSDAKPFALSGPPEASQAFVVSGTGTASTSPQGCTTVTEETAVRRHWGRTYLPTLGGSSYDNNGRLIAAQRSAIGTLFHDWYATLQSNQYFPVVPTTQVDKQPTRALQSVSGIRIDDVTDVHRSRRWRHALVIDRYPLQAEQQPAVDELDER